MNRFTDKVRKTETCWLFEGGIGKSGYGVFWLDGKSISAHRFAYELWIGELPEGAMVLHSCGNRTCVNPAHLRLGDHAENMRDMVQHGKHLRGERHHFTPLTKDDVRDIRASYDTTKRLARRYGISTTAIYNIKARKSWKHVK